MKLVVEPALHPQQYPSLYPLLQDEDGLQPAGAGGAGVRDGDDLEFVERRRRALYDLHTRSQTNLLPSSVRRKEKPRVCHEISLIGPNDIIGLNIRQSYLLRNQTVKRTMQNVLGFTKRFLGSGPGHPSPQCEIPGRISEVQNLFVYGRCLRDKICALPIRSGI